MNEACCQSCGATFQRKDGPTHPYLESSPECWEAFGRLIGKEYEDFGVLWKVHQLAVDAYALQHPGQASKKTAQSLWIHLTSLYLQLEKKKSGEVSLQKIKKIADHYQDEYQWIAPPRLSGEINVAYVLQATSKPQHKKRVRLWARAVWSAWTSAHNDEIRKTIRILLKTK